MSAVPYTAFAAAQPLRRTLLPPPPCCAPPLASQRRSFLSRGAHGTPCHICLAAQQPAAFDRSQGSQAAGGDERSTWEQIRQRVRSWDGLQVATALTLLLYLWLSFRVFVFFGAFGVLLWAMCITHFLLRSWGYR